MTSMAQGFMPQQQQQQQRGFGMPQQQGFGGFGGGYQPTRQGFGMPQQQQQRGFGGGYGMPQQQQGFGGFGGGYGGGYGMPQQQQGFGGGYGMPQQQRGFGGGFGGGFGMPQQQRGFGGGYGMPQQQQGFGGGYGMPQQQRGFGRMSGFNQMPQQLMGGPQPSQQERQYNQQLNAISQNMLQQYGGDQGNPAYQAAMQAQDQQLRGQFGIPQSVAAQPGSLTAAPQDFNQMREAQAAALQSRGMPQSDGGMDAGMGAYNQMSAEQNMAARANQPPMNAQSLSQMANMLRGIGGALGGGSQSVAPQQQMPPSPYTQQTSQEDPRMQAMRYMQLLNLGG